MKQYVTVYVTVQNLLTLGDQHHAKANAPCLSIITNTLASALGVWESIKVHQGRLLLQAEGASATTIETFLWEEVKKRVERLMKEPAILRWIWLKEAVRPDTLVTMEFWRWS